MTKLSTVLPVIYLFIAIGLASCITDGEPDYGSELSSGDKLPDFSIELNNNTILSSPGLLNQRCVLVFFNTACTDCRRELPLLQQVYEKTYQQVRWVAIAREESDASISKFWSEKGITIPYSPQPDRQVFTMFASSGIPRLYLSDKGIITHVFGPENMPSPESLYEIIKGEE